jgi:GGDEF domain-containing protein
MTETLDRLWGDGRKCPDGAAMLMCDFDDFKKLNDHSAMPRAIAVWSRSPELSRKT